MQAILQTINNSNSKYNNKRNNCKINNYNNNKIIILLIKIKIQKIIQILKKNWIALKIVYMILFQK